MDIYCLLCTLFFRWGVIPLQNKIWATTPCFTNRAFHRGWPKKLTWAESTGFDAKRTCGHLSENFPSAHSMLPPASTPHSEIGPHLPKDQLQPPLRKRALPVPRYLYPSSHRRHSINCNWTCNKRARYTGSFILKIRKAGWSHKNDRSWWDTQRCGRGWCTVKCRRCE